MMNVKNFLLVVTFIIILGFLKPHPEGHTPFRQFSMSVLWVLMMSAVLMAKILGVEVEFADG